MSVQEKILAKYKVKVIKRMPDARISIAGCHFIAPENPGHDGTEIDGRKVAYAVIPAPVADHVKDHNKNYDYSDPYLPEDEKKK